MAYNAIGRIKPKFCFEIENMTRKPSSLYADYVVEKYAAGLTTQEIGREIGFSNVTVATLLKNRGVSIRGHVHDIDPSLMLARFDAGESVNSIARSFAVTEKVIARILRKNGRDTSLKLITLSDAAVISLHNSGIGLKGIAERLGTSHTVVARHLVAAGESPRNRSEQQFARMANSTPEQIKRLTEKAHKAATGRTRSIEELSKSAVTRHRNGSQRTSAYEADLIKMLRSFGLDCREQTPIGPYNCDITTGSVAVEVWGGHWHFHGAHAARNEERFHYIFNQGWHIIAIVISNSYPLTPAVARHLVALVNTLSSDPSPVRQYRVIWGAGDKSISGSSDDDKITIKPPLVNARDIA